MLPEELVRMIKALPKSDRVPVIESILKSAGGDVERRVLDREAQLKANGLSPTDALVGALEGALHAPGGARILAVLSSAASYGAVEDGIVPAGERRQVARKFKRVLETTEDVDSSLGFVTAIAAAAGVALEILGMGIKAIRRAVHKAREKRRAYKRRMEPLTTEEMGTIIAQVVGVSRRTRFEDAIPEILEFINGVREGRRGFILQPNRTVGSRRAGSQVNEYADLRSMFNVVLAQFQQQEQQAAVVQKRKGDATIAVAAGAGALMLLGALWYVR